MHIFESANLAVIAPINELSVFSFAENSILLAGGPLAALDVGTPPAAVKSNLALCGSCSMSIKMRQPWCQRASGCAGLPA